MICQNGEARRSKEDIRAKAGSMPLVLNPAVAEAGMDCETVDEAMPEVDWVCAEAKVARTDAAMVIDESILTD